MFSTPLVAVLGCSQPAERPTAPKPAGDGHVATAPGDASVEAARIRAAFEDASARCVPSLMRTCNPPAPDAWVAAVREGEVVDIQRGAEGVRFIVRVSAGPAIGRGWNGVFLDGSSPIAGSEFEIVDSRGSLVTGFVARGRDVPSMRVRMTEPARD